GFGHPFADQQRYARARKANDGREYQQLLNIQSIGVQIAANAKNVHHQAKDDQYRQVSHQIQHNSFHVSDPVDQVTDINIQMGEDVQIKRFDCMAPRSVIVRSAHTRTGDLMPTLLLDAASLAASLSSGSWLVLDVRHALTDPDAGHRQFLEGHIPGAVFLHQDNDLAGAPTGHNGRHPLPDPTILSRQLTDAGLAPNTHVVVYDADTGAFAARAWWLLRWLGHDKVSMLDGG